VPLHLPLKPRRHNRQAQNGKKLPASEGCSFALTIRKRWRWYQEHLGIELTPTSLDSPVWRQQAGPTVFSPFPETTKYFGDPNKAWMVNFRVQDLDKMAAQLRAAGIEVKIYPQYPNGRFARIHDPEGNPIELWEPKEPGPQH
jgi:predicted enzyme related to lactoylglutathione lyase